MSAPTSDIIQNAGNQLRQQILSAEISTSIDKSDRLFCISWYPSSIFSINVRCYREYPGTITAESNDGKFRLSHVFTFSLFNLVFLVLLPKSFRPIFKTATGGCTFMTQQIYSLSLGSLCFISSYNFVQMRHIKFKSLKRAVAHLIENSLKLAK